MGSTILSVNELSIHFKTKYGLVNAVDNVSFDIEQNQKIGIVGESGSGKSVICRSLLQLLPPYADVTGKAIYKDKNIFSLTNKEMYDIRGKEISMIFQEPMTSLNPLFTIGNQLIETICLHQKANKKEARDKALEMLKLVNIPLPEQRLKQYPFELSGGMRQRVMIAIALSCNPHILIADEPTTALDVTIQAQILELIKKLNKEFSTSLILITHDLGVIVETVETVLVMYAGHMVEYSDVKSVFHDPLHPYTKGLLEAMPKMDDSKGRLASIPGTVPSVYEMPSGCRFYNRCSKCKDICQANCPPLFQIGERRVKCWMYGEEW